MRNGMKRFMVFFGEIGDNETTNGKGGMNDFLNSFDTLEKAKKSLLKLPLEFPSVHWVHIFDWELGVKVYSNPNDIDLTESFDGSGG